MIVYGKTDAETVRLTSQSLGMDEIDVHRMLAITRETTGDVVEVKNRPLDRPRRRKEEIDPARDVSFRRRRKPRLTVLADTCTGTSYEPGARISSVCS